MVVTALNFSTPGRVASDGGANKTAATYHTRASPAVFIEHRALRAAAGHFNTSRYSRAPSDAPPPVFMSSE